MLGPLLFIAMIVASISYVVQRIFNSVYDKNEDYFDDFDDLDGEI
jgi:hypothetical protein